VHEGLVAPLGVGAHRVPFVGCEGRPGGQTSTAGLSAASAAMCRSHSIAAVAVPGRRPGARWPVRRAVRPAASSERYQRSQPVRSSRMSPVSTWVPLPPAPRARRRARSGRPRRSRSGDLRPHASDQRRRARRARRCRAPPTHPHRALVVDPAVEAVERVTDVAEAVPLARGLGVPVREAVVVARTTGQPAHVVRKAGRPEEGRVGRSSSKLRENTRASTTADNPARVLSSPSRLRQPNRSSSPQTPHDDPGGSPSRTGRSAKSAAKGPRPNATATAASSVWLRDLRMPERYDSRTEPAVGRTHAVTCGRANVKARAPGWRGWPPPAWRASCASPPRSARRRRAPARLATRTWPRT